MSSFSPNVWQLTYIAPSTVAAVTPSSEQVNSLITISGERLLAGGNTIVSVAGDSGSSDTLVEGVIAMVAEAPTRHLLRLRTPGSWAVATASFR